MVASAHHAHVHAPARHVVGDDAPRGVHTLVLVVVVPEPHVLHREAVCGRVVVGTRVGVDEPRRLVDAPHASVALDVLRVVEADVGVRRLEPVELPLAHRREVRGQAVRGHELVDGLAGRVLARDHAPPVTRDHRVGREGLAAQRRVGASPGVALDLLLADAARVQLRPRLAVVAAEKAECHRVALVARLLAEPAVVGRRPVVGGHGLRFGVVDLQPAFRHVLAARAVGGVPFRVEVAVHRLPDRRPYARVHALAVREAGTERRHVLTAVQEAELGKLHADPLAHAVVDLEPVVPEPPRRIIQFFLSPLASHS